MRHRANLDILRAFAIITVLIDHLVPTLLKYAGLKNHFIVSFTAQIGHAGVIAFFVHTSLVLMYSLERMHQEMNTVTLRFYIRRFFRIYPLMLFVILMALLFHIPSTTWRAPVPVTSGMLISNLLLVQNVVVKKSVLAPLWSLPYEMQMYLVLPALFLVARKRRGPFYLGALIVFFCLFGVYLGTRTGHLNMAAYIPCFLAGVLCYSLRDRISSRIPSWLWPPFVLTMMGLFCLTNEGGEPVYWIGWLYSLVLGLAINAFQDSKMPSLNFAAERTALYSYGMYLVHVPVLYLIFMHMHIDSLVWGSILYFGMTLGVSMLTYHLLESPFIELGRRLSSKSPNSTPRPIAFTGP